MNKKIEGYWYSDWDSESRTYPMPVPYQLSEEEAKEIFDLITNIEQRAKIFYYKGYAESRIDGSLLGDHEFEYKGWVWPGDFAPYYVLRYRVRPTDEFLNFIGYKNA